MNVQAEVHSEQKTKNVRVQRDLKRTSESHPVSSDSEGKVLKSKMQSSTHAGMSVNSSSDLPFHIMLLGIFLGAVWKLGIKEMREINGVLIDVPGTHLHLGVCRQWVCIFLLVDYVMQKCQSFCFKVYQS